MVAAVAATMASVSMADISIKGDAHVRYANIDADSNSPFSGRDGDNSTGQRVRLHVTGKSGDTTLKLGLRNDGGTRVSGGPRQSEGATTGSGRGIGSGDATFATDYLFLTTKIGALNIKAGDWWDSTGLGVARKGRPAADRVEFSTKVSGWKVGVESGADSGSTVLTASGKVSGFTTKIEHDTNATAAGNTAYTPATAAAAGTAANTAATAAATAAGATAAQAAAAGAAAGAIATAVAPAAGKYTDISIKGKVGAVGIAAEYFSGDRDDNKDADAKLVHVWTKANNITWHAAYATTDAGKVGLTGGNSKFSPLGVSILGTAPGVNGKIALGNFGNFEDTVYGIRADAKIKGMGVQAAIGKLKLNDGIAFVAGDPNSVADGTFVDLIVTRSLGKGSDIKFSAGRFEKATSFGTKLSVKF
jgi:hypothetical protein